MLLVCLIVGGCGGGGASKPKPVSGPAKQVASVIWRLQKATAAHDFATICRPLIRIQAVEIQDGRAAAGVQTTGVGQAPTTDVIRLVREKRGFRIVSLGR